MAVTTDSGYTATTKATIPTPVIRTTDYYGGGYSDAGYYGGGYINVGYGYGGGYGYGYGGDGGATPPTSRTAGPGIAPRVANDGTRAAATAARNSPTSAIETSTARESGPSLLCGFTGVQRSQVFGAKSWSVRTRAGFLSKMLSHWSIR